MQKKISGLTITVGPCGHGKEISIGFAGGTIAEVFISTHQIGEWFEWMKEKRKDDSDN